MAFNKKKKRPIVVDGYRLYWSATGGDGTIHLSILSDFEQSGRVFADFGYHQIEVPSTTNGYECIHLVDQFIITPYIVRQVAQMALAQGWKPQEPGDDLCLSHVEEKIDLRLDQNRISALKKSSS